MQNVRSALHPRVRIIQMLELAQPLRFRVEVLVVVSEPLAVSIPRPIRKI